MKRLLIALLFCLPLRGMSQAIEMINYEWDKKASLHKLSDEELKEPVVIIYNERVIEYYMNKNDEMEQYVFGHRIIRLNDNKAVEDFNKIYIPVSSPSYLINFKARSISKDGLAKEMLKGEMKEVMEKGVRYMSLAVEGLEKGSELEFYYILQKNTSKVGSEYLQSGVHVRKSDIKIISPENIVIACKSYNGGPVFQDTIIEKKRYHIGTVENIQPSYEEKYAYRDACLMRVEFKLLKNLRKSSGSLFTYADAGKNTYNNLTNLEKGEQKDIEKLVSKLDLKNKTNEEKIRVIEGWLKTNLHLNEASDAKDLSEVIKTGIGGTLQMNKLCAMLLKTAQIKFEIVVTISHFEKNFDPDFESWTYLDDLILYFPDQDMYLMPTNYATRLGLIPPAYIGNYALFIKEVGIGDITSAVTSVKKLPLPTLGLSRDIMDITIQFSKDMSQVNQHTYRSMGGYLASTTRPFYFYSSEDKKKELLESIMNFDIDGVKLTNLKASNYNLNSQDVKNDFVIEADLAYSSLIEKADKTYLFKVGAVIGTQVEMYQAKPRQKPISIDFMHNQDRHITITIPDGYVAKGLDALNTNITGGEADKPSMGFISSYTLKGNKLEINIHEFYENLYYPATLYDNFRKVINASADFNKVTIVFEKKI